LYASRLEAGSNASVYTEIYVAPTTTAPTATLTVTATYLDEDLQIVRSDDYRLIVLLRGSIEISLTDIAVIPSTPVSGSPFSITVTVTNIGTSTASAAYAIPTLGNIPVRPFGSRSVYIGNIEVNLPTAFTLNLQLDNTTESSTTIPVVLSYMDNLRTAHNITFSVPITITPKTSSTSTTQQRGYSILGIPLFTFVALLAVFAAIIVISVFLMRRRMRKKE